MEAHLARQPNERIWLIDAIRGFAIFGILWVNIALRSDPIQVSALSQPDDCLKWFIAFSADYKFRSMFAFLFGLSIALQTRRAKSGAFMPQFLRRQSLLFLFGVAHFVFWWPGDILALYAICGLVVLAFRNASPKVIYLLVFALLSVPLLQHLAGIRLYDMARVKADVASAYPIYGEGTFWEITQRRIYDYRSFWLPSLLASFPRVLAMMLLGVLLYRESYFERTEERLSQWKRICIVGYLVGIPANALYAFWKTSPAPSALLTTCAKAAHAYGSAFLCMAYVATLVLLSRKTFWHSLLKRLAPVGRMALTAYLGHSVICAFVFLSYGMGLFGRFSPGQDAVLAIAICAGEVVFANLWFKYLKLGPLEWLWRWATYGARPSLLVPRHPAPALPRTAVGTTTLTEG